MAVRNLLHMDKLESFEDFLRAEGYMILPVSRNPYEALRARKGKDTVIIYRRSDAKEHLSIMDKDFQLVERFLKGEREPPEDLGGMSECVECDLPWS